ncbi:M-phase phosphoprotein 6 [Stigmatopora nigra]
MRSRNCFKMASGYEGNRLSCECRRMRPSQWCFSAGVLSLLVFSTTMSSDTVKLSKNVLRMKFMQRGLDAETKEQLREDGKRIISEQHWYLDLPQQAVTENLIVEEKSVVPLEELLYGRMSFRGFNPEVEKLMASINPRRDTREEVDEDMGRMQTDVTDEEMALRYESLVGTMKKKFARKRQRESVDDEPDVDQRKFVRPRD